MACGCSGRVESEVVHEGKKKGLGLKVKLLMKNRVTARRFTEDRLYSFDKPSLVNLKVQSIAKS